MIIDLDKLYDNKFLDDPEKFWDQYPKDPAAFLEAARKGISFSYFGSAKITKEDLPSPPKDYYWYELHGGLRSRYRITFHLCSRKYSIIAVDE